METIQPKKEKKRNIESTRKQGSKRAYDEVPED